MPCLSLAQYSVQGTSGQELSTIPPAPPNQTSSNPPPQEPRLEALNELPEVPPPPPPTPSISPSWPRGDTWLQQLDELEDGDGMGFSGNGLTELETRHEHILRAPSFLSLPSDLRPEPTLLHTEPQQQQHQGDDEEEEDIFQSQGYLPLSPHPAQPRDPTGNDPPAQPVTSHRGPPEPPKPSGLEPQDCEGSGFAPLPAKSAL